MLSIETARQIDLLCDEFESAWRQGTPRPIEEYLRSADATWIPALRAELLQVELECRFQRGEQPRTEEYATRFPECLDALQGWFADASAAASLCPTVAPTSTVDHAPAIET